ncbi:sugar phosphate isomerase/epimerase [Nibrella saemangeumensis]|uniref:Sugar phosphate isomerase/epimerase n=1 Tax=Nibrella saemangeumensis TaxID=1084526 RepID=A0ABP8MZB9_9BACT
MKKNLCLSLLLCLLALTTIAQSKKFGKLLKETPGMVSYTMRASFAKDVPGTLDKIKAMGITNMEMSSLFGKSAAEMRKYLDERGMRCSSYGVQYNALKNNPDSIIRNAKTLGAEFVRLSGVPHKGDFTLEDAKRTVGDFNQFGRKLKENGLTFVYHNHGFEFQPYQDGTLFDYIVQNTNPDNVSYEMDILWVFHPGHDPEALLKKYPKRFKLMHIKDLKKGVKGDFSGSTPPENDVTLGTGQLNLPAILKAAQKTAIKYYYIEDESPLVEQQVPQSIAYLKSL